MLIRYSVLNLLRRKARTLYAMIGIAIALSVVVAIVSATQGVRRGVENMLQQYRGDLIIYREGAMGVANSQLPENLTEPLRQLDGVEALNPYSLQVAGMTAKGFDNLAAMSRQFFPARPDLANLDSPRVPVLLLGYPTDAFLFDKLTAIEGTARFSSPDANEILIGVNARDMLHSYLNSFYQQSNLLPAQRAMIEKTFFDPQFKMPRPVINGVEFNVVGIFETGTYMDTEAIIPLQTFQRVFNHPGEVNGFLVRTQAGADVSKLKQTVKDMRIAITTETTGAMHGQILAPDAELPAQTQPGTTGPGSSRMVDLVAKSADELLKGFGNEYEKVQQMILAIAFLAGIGGAVSVLNTMASNVHERTREIGLLRAVGWTRKRLILAILLEGCIIALVGGVLGCVLGVIELDIVRRIIEYNPVPDGYSWAVFAQAMAIAFGLGILGSLLPALRASRMAPVDALREE